MDFQQFIRDALELAGDQFCSVNFTKANGEPRQITFRPNDHTDVKGCNVVYDRNQIRIRETKNAETGKGEWRSFVVGRIVSLKANGQEFHFDHETNTVHEVT